MLIMCSCFYAMHMPRVRNRHFDFPDFPSLLTPPSEVGELLPLLSPSLPAVFLEDQMPICCRGASGLENVRSCSLAYPSAYPVPGSRLLKVGSIDNPRQNSCLPSLPLSVSNPGTRTPQVFLDSRSETLRISYSGRPTLGLARSGAPSLGLIPLNAYVLNLVSM